MSLLVTLVLTGTATYYDAGLIEVVAKNRGMDLSGYHSGVALNDPRHLGDVVWLDWGDEVTGPHLVIDCAQEKHIPERERLGRVVEVSAEVAMDRGFYGVGPVPVKVLFKRPRPSRWNIVS